MGSTSRHPTDATTPKQDPWPTGLEGSCRGSGREVTGAEDPAPTPPSCFSVETLAGALGLHPAPVGRVGVGVTGTRPVHSGRFRDTDDTGPLESDTCPDPGPEGRRPNWCGPGRTDLPEATSVDLQPTCPDRVQTTVDPSLPYLCRRAHPHRGGGVGTPQGSRTPEGRGTGTDRVPATPRHRPKGSLVRQVSD